MNKSLTHALDLALKTFVITPTIQQRIEEDVANLGYHLGKSPSGLSTQIRMLPDDAQLNTVKLAEDRHGNSVVAQWNGLYHYVQYACIVTKEQTTPSFVVRVGLKGSRKRLSLDILTRELTIDMMESTAQVFHEQETRSLAP